jgi:23S rRNA G2445 N2-methylase RlmL
VKKENPAKEHFQRIRRSSCEQLWTEEVAAFDRAGPRERMDRVAVIRAVGVVFSEAGTPEQKERARQWLRALLEDPEEKIRRYAMTALPKIGADEHEETKLLTLLDKTSSERERKSLGRALEKIGGAATLEVADRLGSRQKVEANLARRDDPGAVCLDRILEEPGDLRIHLRCRSGLEEIVEDELQERIKAGARFRLIRRGSGLLVIAPVGSLRFSDVYDLRCFSAASLVLGTVKQSVETGEIAAVVASPAARRILETFTEGPVRYRLDFMGKGHQRAGVRNLARHVYERCPALLNDSRSALWQINIFSASQGCTVELAPRLKPDPRFAYRQDDVPAASHPPLAACMARLAGPMDNETIWDPFCGSGLELVECVLCGGVRKVFGTDRDADAVAVAQKNLAAASANPPETIFRCGDFRTDATVGGLGSVSLIVTNPPMGRRVPIPDLRGLIEDFFAVAAKVLRPGGRLVFANPLAIQPESRSLKLQFRKKIDLGGFHVHLEKYEKVKPASVSRSGL